MRDTLRPSNPEGSKSKRSRIPPILTPEQREAARISARDAGIAASQARALGSIDGRAAATQTIGFNRPAGSAPGTPRTPRTPIQERRRTGVNAHLGDNRSRYSSRHEPSRHELEDSRPSWNSSHHEPSRHDCADSRSSQNSSRHELSRHNRMDSRRRPNPFANSSAAVRGFLSRTASGSSNHSARSAASGVINSTKGAIGKAKDWKERRKAMEEERRRAKLKAKIGKPTPVENVNDPSNYVVYNPPYKHQDKPISYPLPPIQTNEDNPVHKPLVIGDNSRMTTIEDFMFLPSITYAPPRTPQVEDSMPVAFPDTYLPSASEFAAERERLVALQRVQDYQQLADSSCHAEEPVSPFTTEPYGPCGYTSGYGGYPGEEEQNEPYEPPRSKWI
ncbi:hypothetical protein P152DRAFT_471260 [Eremomyces bilateralis CBS 781.70]|uniref:Uncharacterized protein n=1 Tax=Eremomyces bilateralis CBS 781.70 TaxID=1392243 RepID=A0A6G1GDD3_9PEZI|nr:uncharacterized protein P152DRAFT_471260 [Eremomyces bilateralis CBS 781.70]KAF1815879.1 hypothetical protein P152DRAFT_471260 [Eremomyces bilateralis CBS 781.70]